MTPKKKLHGAARPDSKWRLHLAQVKKTMPPGTPFSMVMQKASRSYKKVTPKKKATPKSKSPRSRRT